MGRFQIYIEDQWKDYAADEDRILKRHYKDHGQFRMMLRGQNYEFDFAAMEQRNLDTGKVRKIRPPLEYGEPERPPKDESHVGAGVTVPSSGAAAPTPTAGKAGTVAPDARPPPAPLGTLVVPGARPVPPAPLGTLAVPGARPPGSQPVQASLLAPQPPAPLCTIARPIRRTEHTPSQPPTSETDVAAASRSSGSLSALSKPKLEGRLPMTPEGEEEGEEGKGVPESEIVREAACRSVGIPLPVDTVMASSAPPGAWGSEAAEARLSTTAVLAEVPAGHTRAVLGTAPRPADQAEGEENMAPESQHGWEEVPMAKRPPAVTLNSRPSSQTGLPHGTV